MAGGLVALLDDVAGIAKAAAASLDDVAGMTGRVGLKAAGVVVDDTAVTPRYVAGLAPERELPIIGRIALGSLRNKLLILVPIALLLSAVAPWAVTPLLMAGGVYLCFEGTEKVWEALRHHHEAAGAAALAPPDAAAVEERKVASAVRTDLILSAEIVAISLAGVADKPLWEQAVVLALVGVAITAGVYGVVGALVKVDDVGLHFARTGSPLLRGVGRGLVRGMPLLLRTLSVVGTAAMLWVGGGILLHGLETFGLTAAPHAVQHLADAAGATVPPAASALSWLVGSAASGLLGVAVGAVALGLVAAAARLRRLPA